MGVDSIFITEFNHNIDCFSGLFKKDFLNLIGKPDTPNDYYLQDVWQYYLSEECRMKIGPLKKCETLLLQFDDQDSLMYLPSITLE